MQTQKLLVVVAVLQGLILLGQWTGQPAIVAPAHAQANLPDPGARQLAMVDELRALNGKMDRLLAALQSGEVKVKVAKDDERK